MINSSAPFTCPSRWQGRISNLFKYWINYIQFEIVCYKTLTSSCKSIARLISTMPPLRVVIIGSGPAGLTSLKTLLCQPEFDPICIEGEFGSGPLLFSFSPLPWTIILQLHTRIRSWRLAVKTSKSNTDYSLISMFDWLFNHLYVRSDFAYWSLWICRWDFRSAQLRKRIACFKQATHCFLGFQIQSGRRPSVYGRLCQISRGLQWQIQSRRKYGRSLGRKWFREVESNAIRHQGNLADEVGWSGWNRQTPSCLREHCIGNSWVFLPMSKEAIGQYINSAPRSQETKSWLTLSSSALDYM